MDLLCSWLESFFTGVSEAEVLNFNLIFVDVVVGPNKNSRYVSLFQSLNVL